jgi:hypothetical protein
MSPNRVVALLTPLVFAPLAGAVSAWIANHFPGTDIKASDLQAIFIGGALIALAPAAQWLHGWQKYEARQDEHEHEIQLANIAAMSASSPPAGTGPALDDTSDLDALTALDEFDDVDDIDADLAPDEDTATVPSP